MDPKDFCYWLQGFLELNGYQNVSPEQLKMIREHLHLVFNKVTPELQDPTKTWDRYEITWDTKPVCNAKLIGPDETFALPPRYC